jgi:hypothetical protein
MCASSSRASVAFKPRIFFYLWCYFFLPRNNRFIVCVQRKTLWALIATTHPIQDMPNSTRMAAHLEQLPDDLCNSIERPIISSISKGISALI